MDSGQALADALVEPRFELLHQRRKNESVTVSASALSDMGEGCGEPSWKRRVRRGLTTRRELAEIRAIGEPGNAHTVFGVTVSDVARDTDFFDYGPSAASDKLNSVDSATCSMSRSF